MSPPHHPPRVRNFPWPFAADSYRYSANVEPAPSLRRTAAGAWGGAILDLDNEYEAELAERADILRRDPSRFVELPHMRPATWDALLWGLRELSAQEPDMRLERDGDGFIWTNGRLGLQQHFRYGADASLPAPPLVFLASQIQDDIVLLDQREGQLWVDAGCVTFASNWSLAFNIGMSFLEIHGPVPHNYADGAIPRAEQFLMRLPAGQAFRRMNWTSTAGHRLDTALDSYADWGASREAMAEAETFSELFHMRVEVQHFIRLPESGTIMFLIRTYLLSLSDILAIPAWARQFASVLGDLPDDIIEYKGLAALRARLIRSLTQADAPVAI
jgi:dimethylamine monooxygenase subunit A